MGVVNKKDLSNLSPKQMTVSQKQSLHLLLYYLNIFTIFTVFSFRSNEF